MKKKRDTCKYCSDKMDAKTTRQEFCSDRCRVYYSRENPVFKIYALVHPVTEEVFYIGKTERELKHRLASHIADVGATTEGRGAKKVEFIKSILKDNLKPNILLLETTHLKSINERSQLELHWIEFYVNAGHPVTNFHHNKSVFKQIGETKILGTTESLPETLWQKEQNTEDTLIDRTKTGLYKSFEGQVPEEIQKEIDALKKELKSPPKNPSVGIRIWTAVREKKISELQNQLK